MQKKISGIIRNPKETMKNIAQEPLVEEDVMIVGILAIMSAIAAYVQSSKIKIVFENVTPEIQPYLPNESTTMIISIVSALAGIFIMWLIGTGIIHLISKAFGGEGKFSPNLITAAGYSMMTPFLYEMSIVNLILMLWAGMI